MTARIVSITWCGMAPPLQPLKGPTLPTWAVLYAVARVCPRCLAFHETLLPMRMQLDVTACAPGEADALDERSVVCTSRCSACSEPITVAGSDIPPDMVQGCANQVRAHERLRVTGER